MIFFVGERIPGGKVLHDGPWPRPIRARQGTDMPYYFDNAATTPVRPEAVQAAVDAVAAELGDSGRILVRESGTEPVIRVMVEAATQQQCTALVDRVIDVICARGHARM